MLVCELLLLLFTSEWLQSQYQQQQQRLHQDIRILFSHTEERLTDSLLNQTIAIVLNNKEPRVAHKMEIQVGTAFDIDTAFANVPLPVAGAPHEFHLTRRKPLSDTHNITIKRIAVKDPSDLRSIQLPEEVKKVFRMALVQTANAKDLYARGFSATIDSGKLRAAFQKDLNAKQAGFIAYWDTTVHREPTLFAYRPIDMDQSTLAVKGYVPYLLKSILPQVAFSIILLLLTGLVFIMAFRTIRRQTQFSKLKDSFISNVSHELKTPVATTKVALEALTTYNAIEDPDRARKYLNVAHWEMNRLSTMIDRIMNIIQTEAGNIQLQKVPLRLAELVEEIVHTLEPILTEKGVTVVYDSMDRQAMVLGDKSHLQGTLYNLLDNAVKYGGDRISISLDINDQQARLTISDNGPGIETEYHKKVFDNFFRVPSGNRHDVKGHGLGLSYARDIVKAHEGNIMLESRPGEGAAFIITLPIISGS